MSTERETSQDTEESEEVRGTHSLESGGGVTGQGTKGGEDRGALTSWRANKEGQFRIPKKRKGTRGTYIL